MQAPLSRPARGGRCPTPRGVTGDRVRPGVALVGVVEAHRHPRAGRRRPTSRGCRWCRRSTGRSRSRPSARRRRRWPSATPSSGAGRRRRRHVGVPHVVGREHGAGADAATAGPGGRPRTRRRPAPPPPPPRPSTVVPACPCSRSSPRLSARTGSCLDSRHRGCEQVDLPVSPAPSPWSSFARLSVRTQSDSRSRPRSVVSARPRKVWIAQSVGSTFQLKRPRGPAGTPRSRSGTVHCPDRSGWGIPERHFDGSGLAEPHR